MVPLRAYPSSFLPSHIGRNHNIFYDNRETNTNYYKRKARVLQFNQTPTLFEL